MLKNFLILIVFLISITSQSCPSFRSAIKLNPSVTANNFSFAVIADGKYYLVGSEEENLKVLEPTGDMPQGFGDSRVTTVIDRKLCNKSQYYLLSLKTSLNESNYETFYTTLDLLNWNQTTVWSQPKPISEYPLLANDPYLKLMAMLGPNFGVSDSINTIFYWEDMKTLFVVIELKNAKSNSSTLSSSVYRYYSIDMRNTCEEIYSYSEGLKDFGSALTSVIDPLDFCFINGKLETSDPLLYCVGRNSFQVNAIDSQNSQNGSLQTKLIGSSGQMPSIDHLPVFGSICKSPEPVQEIGIMLRIVSKRVLKLESKKKIESPTERRIDSSDGVHKVIIETTSSTTKAKPQAEESSSLVFIIAIICLIVVFLVFVIVLSMTARKRNSIARM